LRIQAPQKFTYGQLPMCAAPLRRAHFRLALINPRRLVDAGRVLGHHPAITCSNQRRSLRRCVPYSWRPESSTGGVGYHCPARHRGHRFGLMRSVAGIRPVTDSSRGVGPVLPSTGAAATQAASRRREPGGRVGVQVCGGAIKAGFWSTKPISELVKVVLS